MCANVFFLCYFIYSRICYGHMKNVDFVILLQLAVVSLFVRFPRRYSSLVEYHMNQGKCRVNSRPPSRCDKCNPSRLRGNNSQEWLAAMLRQMSEGKVCQAEQDPPSVTYVGKKQSPGMSPTNLIHLVGINKIDFTFHLSLRKTFL